MSLDGQHSFPLLVTALLHGCINKPRGNWEHSGCVVCREDKENLVSAAVGYVLSMWGNQDSNLDKCEDAQPEYPCHIDKVAVDIWAFCNTQGYIVPLKENLHS